VRLYIITTALELNKIEGVLQQFAERVSSGIGPEAPNSEQFLKVLQGGGCQVMATLVPQELIQG